VDSEFTIWASPDEKEFCVVLLLKRGDKVIQQIGIQPVQVEITYYEIQKQKALGKIPTRYIP